MRKVRDGERVKKQDGISILVNYSNKKFHTYAAANIILHCKAKQLKEMLLQRKYEIILFPNYFIIVVY